MRFAVGDDRVAASTAARYGEPIEVVEPADNQVSVPSELTAGTLGERTAAPCVVNFVERVLKAVPAGSL
ncbi:MAG: hypothetical protein ACYDD7_21430, partial [Acidimicrobiales bacterium]